MNKFKKSTIAIAFAAISAFSFSAIAQNNATDNSTTVKTEKSVCTPGSSKCDGKKDKCDGKKDKCDRKKSDNTKNADCRKASKKDKSTASKARKNPFEGLNLTAEQQSKIDALNAERKQAAENAKKERSEAKANRTADKKEKQNLTAEQKQAMKAKKAEEMKQRAERRNAERRDYLNSVKSILTPEQYQTYLENSYLSHHAGRKAGMRGKDGKGMKQHARKAGKPNAKNRQRNNG